MIHLLAGAAAVTPLILIVLTSRVVTAAGLVGLVLAAVAIVARSRWLATAVACLFLAAYAAALAIERAPLSIASALGLGLALVIFVEAVDLTARIRGAAIEGGVVRAALGRWLGVAAGVFVAAVLAVALAGSLVSAVPDAVAPLLAAAAALGSVLIVASLVRRAT